MELQNIQYTYEIIRDSENRKLIDEVLVEKIDLFRNFEAQQQEIIRLSRKEP